MIRLKISRFIHADVDPNAGKGGASGAGGAGGASGAPTPTPGPAPTGPEWAKTLPETVRNWDEVKNSPTLEKFWEQVSNMRSFLGQSIRIPSAEAGAEDWAAFNSKLIAKVPTLVPRPKPEDEVATMQLFDALGRPQKPEEYSTPQFTPPEGVTLNTAPIEQFKAVAHAAGLTKKQFEKVVQAMTNKAMADAAAANAAMTKEVGTLTTEWGAAFDQNYKRALSIAEKTGAPAGLIEVLKAAKADAATVKWLYKVADAFKDTNNAANDRGGTVTMTPAEATARIREIYNNPKHAFFVTADPGHKDALQQMLQLVAYSNPAEMGQTTDVVRRPLPTV